MLGKEEKKDIETRFTLLWRGIAESKLRLYDGDLYGMEFARVGELIETRFDDYTWGLDGFIRSTSLEVTHFEASPVMSSLHPADVADHEIYISLA